jgi:hypothetical protein
VLVFLIGLLLRPIPPAGAQGAKFEATLSGKEQAPPIDTPAKVTFGLSGSGKSLHCTLSVADIEDASMAHIHIGHVEEEGPITAWLGAWFVLEIGGEESGGNRWGGGKRDTPQ